MLYTVADVAEKLNISVRRVRQLAIDMGMQKRFGRDWLFTESDLAAMRQRRTVKGRPPATPPDREEP